MALTISVRFLTGYCVAARSKVDPNPEWPPHPARLFMALAAAYFESEQDAGERDALRWLESLDAPHLCVPTLASTNQAISTFVPVNYNRTDGGGNPIRTLPSLNRHPAERLFPRTYLSEEDDILHFIWNDGSEADISRHYSALRSLCSRVGRLGHSTSFVQMWADASSPPGKPANLVPTAGRYEMRLRTVANTSGTLDRLARMFQSPPLYRPTIPDSHGYVSRKDRAAEVPGTIFDPELEIFRLTSNDSSFQYLDIATILRLTRQLHEAMLKNVGANGGIPESISGHKPDGSPSDRPHIAYMPIPFVGGEFGDGHLLGFALAVPKEMDSDPEAVKALKIGLDGLVNNGLTLGPLGTWKVEEDLEPSRRGRMLQDDTWTAFPAGAKTWASVTPVVFDQHPKSAKKSDYLEEAAELISGMFERIGLTKPRVRITPVSRFRGVPTAYNFPRMQRKDGSERRQTHVIVEFDGPVIGPILIGAGRYRGYGLLKPVPKGGKS